MANHFSAVKKINPRGIEDDCLEIFVDTFDVYRLNNLVAELGTYTFVVWYCSATECNIKFNVLGTEETVSSTAVWNKFVKTVEYDGIYNNIDIIQDLDSTIYLYEAYITKGSQDKSWSLAPEDWEDGCEERDNLINETMTFAQQTADKFTWLVKSGTNETNFTLTSRTAELVSEQINLKGLVTFSGLSGDTQAKINGNVVKVDVMYALGTSTTIAPTSGWKTTAPQWTSGKYMWQKTVITYVDNSTKESTPTCISGSQGQKGDQGDSGIGITSIVEQYYLSSSKTGQIGGKWSAQCPNWVTGYYIWTRSVVTWEDGSTTTTEPVLANAINDANENADDAKNKSEQSFQLSSAHENTINSWISDAITEGVVTINGGYIKSNTINTDHLIVEDIFATGTSVMNIINAQEIDAKRITSGQIQADKMDVHGLSVKHSMKVNADGENLETLSISDEGDITMRGNIESYNYIAGKTGWAIKNDGDAEFNDVTVRGSVISNYGGIASCGGSGTNLIQHTSFFDGTDGGKWVLRDGYSIDTTFLCNGTNTIKFSRTGLTDSSLVQTYSSRTKNPVTPVVGKTYTASAKFYTKNSSDIDGAKPYIGIWVYDSEGTAIQRETVTVPFADNEWVDASVSITCDTGASCVAFVVGAYRNGTFWFGMPKIEEGNTATAWGLSPDDGIKQVVHWAGTSYDNREDAPWIVYSDGSMKATLGEFGGVFTGDIQIGNISIIDPSSSSGGDAILTIQNGDSSIKRVQLRDTGSSDFAQNIKITNNTYSTMITLGQDGYGVFNGGITAGSGTVKSTLAKDTITLNGSIIDGSTANTINILPTSLNIGSLNQKTGLTVYGSSVFKEDVTFDGDVMLGSKFKITTLSNGIDIDFIE